jgi:hypothetical protein
MLQSWDPAKQSFTREGRILQTSVYRPYPGSKTNGSTAHPDHGEDDEVIATNDHATEMFKKAAGQLGNVDKRPFYRLVGAIWLDKPTGPNGSFVKKRAFDISLGASTDDDEMIAGEGRLGSTAMESFTETEDGAPHCFACHDTQAVSRNGHKLLQPGDLNVSHVLSKYLELQQAQTR